MNLMLNAGNYEFMSATETMTMKIAVKYLHHLKLHLSIYPAVDE